MVLIVGGKRNVMGIMYAVVFKQIEGIEGVNDTSVVGRIVPIAGTRVYGPF